MSEQRGIARLAFCWSNSPREIPDNEGLYK